MISALQKIAYVAVLAAALFNAPIAHARAFDIIVTGKGGEAEYEKQFADWGERLQKILTSSLGHAPENVALLTETIRPNGPLDSGDELDRLRAAFKNLQGKVTPDDELFVYLIGHGSYENGVSKFDIDGPDLSAEDLGTLIAPLAPKHSIVINASSTSAGFINVLSGKVSIVCTATKGVDERNATDFAEYFIQGLEDNSADQNRDERISVLEACQQGALLTQAGYTGQGLILTEHALLDDNGDGLGSRLPIDPRANPAQAVEIPRGGRKPANGLGIDGGAASTIYLKDFTFSPAVPRTMVEGYTAALDSVEKLKARKAEMKEDDYYAELEKLLLKAAEIHRDIRAIK